MKVIAHEHQRYIPRCKTTHYTLAAMLQKRKAEAGATEILYTLNGNVLEASTSNIFIVKNGTLITPEKNILHGITRAQSLKIAESLNIEVQKREVTVEEVLQADEVFLTSSYKDVLPVTEIEGSEMKGVVVGELTKKFIEEYQKVLSKM